MVPIRSLFRSRWAALIWSAGICWSAIQFSGEHKTDIDTANAADTNIAQASALAAEVSD